MKNSNLIKGYRKLSKHIANWKLIKQIAIDYTEGNNINAISLKEIERIFSKKHPERNIINVPMDTRMLTVNSQSRLSYLRIYGRPNPGKKIRNAHLINSSYEYPRLSSPKNEKDFFFDVGNLLFEIYDPSKHGTWEIILSTNDVNRLVEIV